jgi:flagellar protein FlaG
MADLTINEALLASAKQAAGAAAPKGNGSAGRAIPRPPTAAEVRTAVTETMDLVAPHAGALEFFVDEGSGRAIVRVMDKETNQVIRQIPGPEMIAIRRVLDRIKGILIRVKA